MSCSEIQNLVHASIDGELDLVRSLEIERHLHECPECARVYQAQLALRQKFRDPFLRFKAPGGLRKNIFQALRQSAPAPLPAPTLRWWSAWRWAGATAVVLLAVLLGGVLGHILREPAPSNLLAQEVIASHVRSLMANHLADVSSTDQHTVKPWFNGKLDFSPPVKDLASAGFPLTGGRLDFLDNRPVAALVYQRAKHVINLFVWPSTEESAEQTLTRQGYHVIHWAGGGMAFWAVSDVNEKELGEFTALIGGK